MRCGIGLRLRGNAAGSLLLDSCAKPPIGARVTFALAVVRADFSVERRRKISERRKNSTTDSGRGTEEWRSL